ncbi:predicted protein [Sclerotinia sclerotiorum 1980 UF-70]|uniref:Uncharacterized protein n=1 Tax=Sclerotinia sclerotiorum (strain ATCC 18683 / 1980 / Ss-1) TaxID=665079 RepID=A7EH19_SCLS1|nr:predicted protein [Sclerotinia sclerotiorum 1980 UF-70]EDO02135.1 predicted protein [Sclerotinia sclerotiorum 1980 UF-70]
MILGAVFSLALLSAIATASSVPICVKDSSTTTSFAISSLSKYTTQFCTEVASSNFSSNTKNYNMGSTSASVISLGFTSASTNCLGNNSVTNCENIYELLFSTFLGLKVRVITNSKAETTILQSRDQDLSIRDAVYTASGLQVRIPIT